MTFQRFFTLLIATSLSVITINATLQYAYPVLQNHYRIAWWSLSLFILISWFMYVIGKIAISSTNKYLFNNIIVGFVILKMTFSIAMLIVYKKTFQPESKSFLVPFFIAYLAFTIFETYFMMKFTRSTTTN